MTQSALHNKMTQRFLSTVARQIAQIAETSASSLRNSDHVSANKTQRVDRHNGQHTDENFGAFVRQQVSSQNPYNDRMSLPCKMEGALGGVTLNGNIPLPQRSVTPTLIAFLCRSAWGGPPSRQSINLELSCPDSYL